MSDRQRVLLSQGSILNQLRKTLKPCFLGMHGYYGGKGIINYSSKSLILLQNFCFYIEGIYSEEERSVNQYHRPYPLHSKSIFL